MTAALHLAASSAGQTITAAKPTIAQTATHMAGMLWYQMLSEMSQTGFDSDSLGTGGSDFQNMFLYNIAQNDFGKYDKGLTDALIKQLGGQAQAPSPAISAPGASPTSNLATMPSIATMGSQAVQPSAPAAPSGTLLQQATNFAQSVWPQIQDAAEVLNVSPVGLLAQTALETGWGAAAAGNNLFGIKAGSGQSGTVRDTHEVVNGVMTPQTATFRDYATPAASISDYIGEIHSNFAAVAGQSTVSGFAHALQASGYATDTNYAAKIISISNSPLMLQVLQTVGAAPAASTTPALK
jgi:flagellar protein FlgJ